MHPQTLCCQINIRPTISDPLRFEFDPRNSIVFQICVNSLHSSASSDAIHLRLDGKFHTLRCTTCLIFPFLNLFYMSYTVTHVDVHVQARSTKNQRKHMRSSKLTCSVFILFRISQRLATSLSNVINTLYFICKIPLFCF